MTTRTVRRGHRVPPPRSPGGELALEPPPEPARPMPAGLGQRLLPAALLLGSVGIVAVMGVSNPQGWLFGGMLALSTLGMLAGGLGRGGSDRAETDENRRDYLRYLAQVRTRIRVVEADQRAALSWSHPEPAALAAVPGGERMWERRVGDADFGQVRIAVGRQRLATRLVAPQTGPVNDLEPVCAWALRRLIRAHSVVPRLPVAVALAGEVRRVSLVPCAAGDRADGSPDGNLPAAVARAMVAQYTVWHSPAEARLVVVAAGDRLPAWDWVKWLPHVGHPTLSDDVGPLRMVTERPAEVGGWLDELVSPVTRALVVVDGVDVRRGGARWLDRPEVTVLHVARHGPDRRPAGHPPARPPARSPARLERGELRLLVAPDRIGTAGPDGRPSWIGRPDRMGVAEAEALARRMARYRAPRAAEADAGAPLRGTVGLPELLGIDGRAAPDAVSAARARWRGSPGDTLRVPIGLGESGEPVTLDLKESARGGSGPHGLCIGATGSGKSELLRTLVLGLAATHSSQQLNMVLVDFKGGATFLGLAELPHVAAVITNLADELSLVDRMAEALAGEINRRQEVLRAAGNVASVHEYERLRVRGRTGPAGTELAPLPALLVVIDEFSELLAQRPELIDLLVGIGRLGRSLEVHLLLASQRLDEGRLRGLESHLSYRIALRTFSPAESRAVLGVPDAHHLPPTPGSGYLALGTDELVRFRAAYVSAPPEPGTVPPRAGAPLPVPGTRPLPFTAARVGPSPAEIAAATTTVLDAVRPDAAPGAGPDPAATVLAEMVTAISARGATDPPAHEVWLPPLDEPPPLGELLGPLTRTGRGLGTGRPGELRIPVGLIDRPYHQRWDPLVADLSGAAGHAAVVGGPQAGKSTLLRTLVLGLALAHTPREVSVFGLDFGGGLLAGLAGLPHVAGVADRQHPDVARRTVAEVVGLLADRERAFRAAGVDSIADHRRRRAAGELDDPHGDVVLVVDGYLTLRSEFEDLEAELLPLASRGLSYGIHLVVSANRWSELRPALKDLLGTRFELRLGDPVDSEVDRRRAAAVPARPGSGLAPDGAQCVVARPALGSAVRAAGAGSVQVGAAQVGAGFAGAVTAVAEAWPGPPVPRVRLLPERLPYPELVAAAGEPPSPAAVPIGIDEARLEPVWLDLAHDPHLICFADAESGKTTLLRVLARGLTDRLPPERARIVQLDYRRTLLGAVPDSHRIGYATTAEAAAAMIDDVVGSLRRRLPGADVTSAQLRGRSWWSGPEVYVLVDDYDLVTGTAGAPNPLAPLLEFLPQAKDVGLHLVLARRSGGAGRALFDPVISRLRELATPGLLLSGSADEGPLLDGVKLGPQPPGRGVLVGRRSGRRRVQLALLEEERDAGAGT